MGHKRGSLDDSGYIIQYLDILEKVPTNSWQQLFAMEEIVLVCFCEVTAFCHRNILTRQIISTLNNRVAYLGWKA